MLKLRCHYPDENNQRGHIDVAGELTLSNFDKILSERVGKRNGLPRYMSIFQMTEALSEPPGTKDGLCGELAMRSAIEEAVVAIGEFAGLNWSDGLHESKNLVSGVTVRVDEKIECVFSALLEALALQSRQARECLTVASPLQRESLWTASYVWTTTQLFGSADWVQTIDAIPHRKGGQSQAAWWNSVLPRHCP